MMGFGLVGCGKISDRHIASLAKCANAELAALCDIQTERMDAARLKYRQLSGSKAEITAYQDITAMLSDARVQTVIIATPSMLHADLAKRAMAAGKHVIVEKPIALSLREVDEIVDYARKHLVCVQVCHQLRYKPVMQRIKELIDAKAMGDLHLCVISMRLQRSQAYYDAAPWRGTWDKDGGMLLNQGIHLIDLMQWFMGDYESVFGSMLRGSIPKQTEDVAAGIVTFKSGAIGIIEANTLTYPNSYDNSITLFGDKGTVSIGGIGLNEIRKWSIDNIPQDLPSENDAADEHLLMYEHFIQAVKGNDSSMIIHASEGKKAVEMIFALYESVRKGQAVPAPLTSFSTTIMTNMEGWK
ncbi:Gfo/Idh/MocA family protein [Paenibacillus sp. N3.4]|uniref:Gfo/Idh/MocA family protein n=1 Tax=Paenibacillus sp. N3.4 TaxID=2603222 RepID=UPI0011CA04CD|nr:Gfo/Idh/MocA family oxidoreductase [Paenibacillus sp. N3.4]TXK84643.1 Gfo/Idh/MocA family oxidoreductase [Paenibacillus sp. N3.4]